jgi:hypothetical protein
MMPLAAICVGADADQCRPGAQRVPGFGGIEPVQATPCVSQGSSIVVRATPRILRG